jgi:hypothetical protein
MMGVSVDLTVVWAFIIGFAVFAYVAMDGFDLAIGILFETFKVGEMRDQAMNSVAPVWDGNETWLVLGGGGLPSLVTTPRMDGWNLACQRARPGPVTGAIRLWLKA